MKKTFLIFALALFWASSAFAQQALVKTVNTIAQLKQQNVNDVSKVVHVLGSSAKGDGGGGIYYWDAASAGAADDAAYVLANSTSTGRWVRIITNSGAGGVTDGDKGDITITSGVWAIDANAVVLATDTSGNFVATISSSDLTVSGSGSENATITISIPAILDLSGKTALGLPHSSTASDNVVSAGQIAFDSNAIDADTGAPVILDQNSGKMFLVPVDADDAPTSGQVPKYNGTTITWEDDNSSSGDSISYDGTSFTDLEFVDGVDIVWSGETGPTPDTIEAHIPNGAVDYAEIQDVSAASRLLGRGSAAGSGDVQEISVGDGLLFDGTTIKTNGAGGTRVGVRRRIWVDAKDMLPIGTSTNVNYIPTTTTDGMNATVVAFDGTTTERAQFQTKFDTWDGSSTDVTVRLSVVATATGDSRWSVEVGSISSGGTFGNILGSAALATKTGTAADVLTEFDIDSFTIGSTPAATDLLYFRISRIGGDAADTSSADEYLLGAWVEYVESTTEQSAL